MLSKNKMVSNALKRLHKDVCTIYTIDAENNWRPIFENIPCRISYDSIDHAKQNGSMERSRFTRKNLIPALEISAVIRLFLDAEYDVPPGSRIRVIRNDKPHYFRAAGYGASYASHREVLIIPSEKFV